MVKSHTLSHQAAATTKRALILHDKLRAINPLDVPCMSKVRSISRKDQAHLTRELFKELGLREISVSTPRGLGSFVEVVAPHRSDYFFDGKGRIARHDEAARANANARRRIQSILLAAFPNHDDESGTDAKWSMG